MVRRDLKELKDLVRRSLDAGSALSGLRREDIEAFVRDLMADPAERRDRVEEVAEEFIARSRRSAELLASFVRAEVRRELERRVEQRRSELTDLLNKAVALAGDFLGARTETQAPPASEHMPAPAAESETAAPARPAVGDQEVAKSAAKTRAAEKRAAKKTPAKKAAAKAAASKVPAKKAAAKKAPAAGSAGQSAATAGAPRRQRVVERGSGEESRGA